MNIKGNSKVKEQKSAKKQNTLIPARYIYISSLGQKINIHAIATMTPQIMKWTDVKYPK